MRFLFLLFLTGLASLVAAQDKTTNPVFLGVKPQYGFIIPHSSAIRSLSQSRPYGLAVDYGWFMIQKKDWQRCNCYSRAGFSISHINFNQPRVLGQATNLMMFAEPFFNYRGRVLTSLRMGVGPTYLNKIYDPEKNPRNLFFSTHLSFIIHLDVALNFRLTRQWFLKVYGKYNHISNGGIQEPNKGMNFPTFGAGLDYLFAPVELKKRQPLPLEEKGIIPSLEVFATMENVTRGEGDVQKRTYSYGLILRGRRRITRLNALNAGVEYLWDGQIKEKTGEAGHSRQISLLTGHDLAFGKFIFSQFWGTYLYAPYYNKPFFQRYALTYQVSDHLRLGVTLKAHAEVAQNFNVLVSYDFK